MVIAALAPCPAAAGEIVIRGLLSIPGGSPEEARVDLEPVRSSYRDGLQDLGLDPVAATARAAVDPTGAFHLEAPGAGMWKVVAHAPGRVSMQYRLTPLLDEVVLPPVELRRAVELTVAVSTEGGAPLARARVCATPRPAEPAWLDNALRGWLPDRRCAETTIEGAVRLPQAAGERLLLSTAAPGVSVRLSETAGPLAALRSSRGRPVRIQVRDAGGRALQSVLVRRSGSAIPLGSTGADGRLETTIADESRAYLLAEAPDGRRATAPLGGSIGAADASGAPTLLTLWPLVRVAGRVTTADGTPLGGALVWTPAEPAAFTRTDGGGNFALGISPGVRRLFAAASGYLQEVRAVARTVDFALRSEAVVKGSVVDAMSRPLPGVELSCMARPPALRSPAAEMESRHAAWTAESGRFELRGVDPAQPCELSAAKPGYRTVRLIVGRPTPGREAAGLRLVLYAARRLRGKVVDAASRPIAGAAVQVFAGIGGGGSAGEPGVFRALADGRGLFELADLPPGGLRIVVTRHGYAPLALAVEPAATAREVDLGAVTLDAGAVLRGTVETPAGEPLAGAEVSARDPRDAVLAAAARLRGEETAHATTDASGVFVLDGLRPQVALDLAVERPGYGQVALSGVRAPAPEPLKVVLTPDVEVSGRTVDHDGEPIAGAGVSLWREGDESPREKGAGSPARTTETDEGGRFHFARVPPGRIGLRAAAPGYGAAAIDGLAVPPGRGLTDVEVVLPPGARVEGRISSADGQPVGGARVMASGESTAAGRAGSVPTASVVSDDEGRYRLDGLGPGRLILTASHRDFPSASRQVDLEPGANSVDLVFAAGVEVRGSAWSDRDEPVPDAEVSLAGAAETPRLLTRSGADGSFVFRRVPPGEYRLTGEKEGFATAMGDGSVHVPSSPVTGLRLEFETGGSIAGRLIGLRPDEAAHLSVSAIHAAAGSRSGRVEGDQFRFDRLPWGAWNVLATVSGSARRAQGRAVLERGAAEVALDLTFSGDLTLTGRALLGGQPVGGLTVLLYGLRSSGTAQTDGRGAFRLTGLEPGSYRLTLLRPDGGLRASEAIELAADREVVVDIPAGTVSGSAVEAGSGRPLAGVVVSLAPVAGDGTVPGVAATATTDAEGSFEVSGIAEGAYRLVARCPGHAAWEQLVAVRAGAPASVRLALRRLGS